MTPQERAESLRQAISQQDCDYLRCLNGEQTLQLIIEHDKQTRRAALLECRDEIGKLMGKDSGNWNRAIVYAADVANKLAQEG